MPRLSSQELYSLRNHIPIERLISQLQMPTREDHGLRRFQCPVCAGFHSATYPNTNLAHCFDCRKKFNTIELVMAVQHSRFREAVSFLQRNQSILTQPLDSAQPQYALPNTQAPRDSTPLSAPAQIPVRKTPRAHSQAASKNTTSQLRAIKQILNKP